MFERIVSEQIKAPKLFFGFFIVIIALAIALAVQLDIDPSFSSLVGEESEYNTNARILQNAFGTNDAILIIIKEDQTTILENAKKLTEIDDYFNTLEETLNQSQYIESIQGPRFDNSERYATYTLQLYAPENNEGFKTVLAQMNTLVAASGPPPGIDVSVTGLPIILDRVTTLLITDNLVTILLTLLFIFLILYFYARDLVFALVSLSVPLTSLIMLAAMMTIFNIDVTITLAAVGVLVLGLGADYSIHIATHYRDARRHHANHKKALLQTIKELSVPITASFLTTLGGFAALIFGVSPSSQNQGIVLALAITIIFFASFLVYPLFITLFAQSPGKPNPFMAKLRGILIRISIYQAKNYKKVILIVAGITVFMIIGASQVQFSTSNSNWIADDDPVSKSFREVNYAFGDSDSLTLILRATKNDLRNVQTARDVNRLVAYLEGIPNIDSISNPFAGANHTKASIYEHTLNNPDFNNDYTITTITLRTQNPGQDEAGNSVILEETRKVVDRIPMQDTEVLFFGDSVRFSELGTSLQQDTGTTTMLGLLFVFIIASAVYMSFTIGLLAMVPIIIAVIWAVGLMGWFGVPFTTLSTGIISLVLGIGVDFSIHLVDGIKRNMKKGIEKAISLTMESAGSAILLSSVTTFVGFMALIFANLLGTQRLGMSLGLSILSVFLVTILLVPAVMAATNKKPKKNRRRT